MFTSNQKGKTSQSNETAQDVKLINTGELEFEEIDPEGERSKKTEEAPSSLSSISHSYVAPLVAETALESPEQVKGIIAALQAEIQELQARLKQKEEEAALQQPQDRDEGAGIAPLQLFFKEQEELRCIAEVVNNMAVEHNIIFSDPHSSIKNRLLFIQAVLQQEREELSQKVEQAQSQAEPSALVRPRRTLSGVLPLVEEKKLLYFDVRQTLETIQARVLHTLGKGKEPSRGELQDRNVEDFHSYNSRRLEESPEPVCKYYREQRRRIEAYMEEFNAQTRKLSRELEAEMDKENSPFTHRNAEVIAQAQRKMIRAIVDILASPAPDRRKEKCIKKEAEKFKEIYNQNFPQREKDHFKSEIWGAVVGIAIAAVGVGLTFLTFYALPFISGVVAVPLFSPEFYTALGIVAASLGVTSATASARMVHQNHYAHGSTARGAASCTKNAALNTAFGLEKLHINSFMTLGKITDVRKKKDSRSREYQCLLEDSKKRQRSASYS